MPLIELKTDADLLEVEGLLQRIDLLSERRDVIVRLSRNYKFQFFKESRIVGLLGSIARHHNLIIRDWNNSWDTENAESYFRSSFVRTGAAAFTSLFVNEKRQPIPFSANDAKTSISADRGIMEPYNANHEDYNLIGKSVTFCCFDPEYSEPLSLAGLVHDQTLFVKEYLELRRQYLTDFAGTPMERFDNANETTVAKFIFELYQNGYAHGRRTLTGDTISGIRSLLVRKHIALNHNKLLAYAGEFTPLQDYIGNTSERDTKFYEISISDSGMGILDGFLAARPDFAATTISQSDRLTLLQRILAEPLTSKVNSPGAGYGLPRMLQAVRELNGFLSLRTDQFWLTNSFTQGEGVNLLPFEGRAPWAKIAGTHFSALFPLRAG